jgi:hypothetical protein
MFQKSISRVKHQLRKVVTSQEVLDIGGPQAIKFEWG